MNERITPTGNRKPPPASKDLARELPGIAKEARQEQDSADLETEIRGSEEALGITTTQGRLVEAGLFIDKKFLDVAIITGEPARPERIFGDKEWAGHLEARLFARQYGDRPLTVGFILALHQRYLDRVDAGKVSTFINGSGGRGGQFIDGRPAPITCTGEQIAAINNNPLLRFGVEQEQDRPNTGYIYYADMTGGERQLRLEKICVWYNDENKNSADPHSTAAIMQRLIISLHPLTGSIMGRVSRVLMNWSLENVGEDPSIVDDVDGDLFLSEEDWVKSVRAGSIRYAEYKLRAEAGEANPVVLFGLEQERLHYEEVLRSAGSTPPALVDDGWHDHSQYEEFLARLRAANSNHATDTKT